MATLFHSLDYLSHQTDINVSPVLSNLCSNTSSNRSNSQASQHTKSTPPPHKQSNKTVTLRVDDLKEQATALLKSSAEQFMRNQNDIMTAMKITLLHLKQVEDNLEQRREILQQELKANQERLQKIFQENMKRAQETADENKQSCQKHLERLGELNQDNQKKYFDTQEDIISQYKKLVRKRYQ